MNKLLICLMTVLTMAFSNAHAAATNIWSGNFDVNNWRSILDIDGSKFASLQSGDKVIFKGSPGSSFRLLCPYRRRSRPYSPHPAA